MTLQVKKRKDGQIELSDPASRALIILTKEQAKTLADALVAATK